MKYCGDDYKWVKTLSDGIRISVGYFELPDRKVYALCYGHPNKNDDYWEYAQITENEYMFLLESTVDLSTVAACKKLYSKYFGNSNRLCNEFSMNPDTYKQCFNDYEAFYDDKFVHHPNAYGYFMHQDYYVIYDIDEHNICHFNGPFSVNDLPLIEAKLKGIKTDLIPKDFKDTYIHNHFRTFEEMEKFISEKYQSIDYSNCYHTSARLWLKKDITVGELPDVLLKRELIDSDNTWYIENLSKPPAVMCSIKGAEIEFISAKDTSLSTIIRGNNSLFGTVKAPLYMRNRK